MLSAFAIKSGRNWKHEVPKQGTRVRRYYDLALTGNWFSLNNEPNAIRKGIIKALKEYDLEIISEPDPDLPTGIGYGRPHRHRCVGKWDGSVLKSVEDVRVALENSVSRDPKGVME